MPLSTQANPSWGCWRHLFRHQNHFTSLSTRPSLSLSLHPHSYYYATRTVTPLSLSLSNPMKTKNETSGMVLVRVCHWPAAFLILFSATSTSFPFWNFLDFDALTCYFLSFLQTLFFCIARCFFFFLVNCIARCDSSLSLWVSGYIKVRTFFWFGWIWWGTSRVWFSGVGLFLLVLPSQFLAL